MAGKIILNSISVFCLFVLMVYPYETAFAEIECLLVAILFAIYALNFKG